MLTGRRHNDRSSGLAAWRVITAGHGHRLSRRSMMVVDGHCAPLESGLLHRGALLAVVRSPREEAIEKPSAFLPTKKPGECERLDGGDLAPYHSVPIASTANLGKECETMNLDPDKLEQLVYTLTDDQKALLRQGLAQGKNLDPETLAAAFNSVENQEMLKKLFADAQDAGAPTTVGPDAGTGDAGTGDAGTHPPHPPAPDPPLTRW